MAKKHKPEEIVAKLRQVKVMTSQSIVLADVVRSIGGPQGRGRPQFRKRSMDGIEHLGLVASTLATLSFRPQVVTTWGSRSAQDSSLATLLMLVAGTSLRIIYGLWRHALAIWLANGVTFLLIGTILWMKASNLLASRRDTG